MNRASLNLGDSPSRCSNGAVEFFKWTMVARKPRYSEQSGVLYFEGPRKVHGKKMRFKMEIGQQRQQRRFAQVMISRGKRGPNDD